MTLPAGKIRQPLDPAYIDVMASYLELLAQKRELDARIARARAEAAAEALAAAREAIEEFGFTPEDLFGKRAKKAGVRAAGKPRGSRRASDGVDRATLDLFASAGMNDAP
jgi:DNA-binding protein H-NS